MVLAVVVGAAVALHFYRRGDEIIRLQIETMLAQHYQGLKVRVGSAELVTGTGIRIRDLSIAELGAEGPHAELLHIDETIIECPTNWQKIVQGNVQARRVTMRRPTLRLTHRPDGVWSAAKLLPPPHFDDQAPEVKVEGGVIEVFDPLKTHPSTLTLREVNLTLMAESASASVLVAADAKPGSRRLQGMFAGDGFRRVEVEGWTDLRSSACSIHGQAEAVEISPELRDSLPNPLAERLQKLPDLRGQINLQFGVSYDAAAPKPLKYDVTGRLTRGRIDDARLPHALTDVFAKLYVDNDRYAIDDLTARSGETTLRLTCRGAGFEPTSPQSVTATVQNFELDRALLDVLPSWLQSHWYKYWPTGTVNADVRATFDGRAWRREIGVRCLNVSFTHHRFPYRLDNGEGRLDLKDDRLTMDLTAHGGNQPVRLTADIASLLSNPTGSFEAEGDNIHISEALLSAIPERSREVVRSLNPRGTINFYAKLWRSQPDEPLHVRVRVAPNRCSIRYDKFPYPLSDISGMLEMNDDAWTFRNIEGTNERARVTCNGRLTPGPQGSDLVLKLVGRDVALEQNLHDALSRHIQQVWDNTRPRGVVDLDADISYLAGEKKFSVGVQIWPQPKSASIEPVYFPYRLDRVKGKIVYGDGRVTFQGCEGWHRQVKVSSEGQCDFSPDGQWKIHFAKLSADHLRGDDRELIQALPERLRKAVEEMKPTGSINLTQGTLDLERGAPGELPRAQWDMRLDLHQTSLQLGGLSVENIFGKALLQGEFDGRQFKSRGELALDAINYKNCQFTQVTGPIWIDDGLVLFGACVDRRVKGAPATGPSGPARTPRPISANALGGKFYLDGWATVGPTSRYFVNATLVDADLARCAKEVAAERRNLRGKIVATADLSGSGRTRNTLSGSGKIRLSDANVYELPVMVSLLKVLSIQMPDQNAFSDATIDYRVEGEHIYFDRIDFHGDAISLRGKGDMDFKSAINLTFYPTVGRGELDLPIIKQIFRDAGKQIMLIYVGGTLQNPEPRQEFLPLVNQTVQQLRGELEGRKQ